MFISLMNGMAASTYRLIAVGCYSYVVAGAEVFHNSFPMINPVIFPMIIPAMNVMTSKLVRKILALRSSLSWFISPPRSKA